MVHTVLTLKECSSFLLFFFQNQLSLGNFNKVSAKFSGKVASGKIVNLLNSTSTNNNKNLNEVRF